MSEKFPKEVTTVSHGYLSVDIDMYCFFNFKVCQ